MSRSDLPVTFTGIAWYRREQWDRVRACSSDRDSMEEKYDDWEQRAKDSEQQLMSKGLLVRRVDIDVDALITWAARNALDINGTTRVDYTNRLLARALGIGPEV